MSSTISRSDLLPVGWKRYGNGSAEVELGLRLEPDEAPIATLPGLRRSSRSQPVPARREVSRPRSSRRASSARRTCGCSRGRPRALPCRIGEIRRPDQDQDVKGRAGEEAHDRQSQECLEYRSHLRRVLCRLASDSPCELREGEISQSREPKGERPRRQEGQYSPPLPAPAESGPTAGASDRAEHPNLRGGRLPRKSLGLGQRCREPWDRPTRLSPLSSLSQWYHS